VAVAGGLSVYAWARPGHSGFDPWWLAAVFGGSLFLGLMAFCDPSLRRAAIFASTAGLAGIGLLFYLDYANILVEYHRWIQRGML
jgi:hypothetical protein